MSKGVNNDVRGMRGSRGMPGGVRGAVKVSQEVKTSARGVQGVEGGLRDPRGLRWTPWVYGGSMERQGCPKGSRGTSWVSEGVSKDVRGVTGSRGTQGGSG